MRSDVREVEARVRQWESGPRRTLEPHAYLTDPIKNSVSCKLNKRLSIVNLFLYKYTNY